MEYHHISKDGIVMVRKCKKFLSGHDEPRESRQARRLKYTVGKENPDGAPKGMFSSRTILGGKKRKR